MADTIREKCQEASAKLQKSCDDKTAKQTELRQALQDVQQAAPGKKEAAQKKVDKINEQLKKLEDTIPLLVAKVKDLDRQARKQEALMKRDAINAELGTIADEEMAQQTSELPENLRLEFVRRAREHMRLSESIRLIKGPDDADKEWLRDCVMAHPSGWLQHEEVNKQYRFGRVGDILVILQDVVEYSWAFTDAVAKLGLQHLIELNVLKVDHTKLLKLVGEGKVKVRADEEHREGRPMTYEDWEQWRARKVNAPKVDVREDASVGKEPVVVIRVDFMTFAVEKLPEWTALKGNEINPLLAANFTVVSQLRGMSMVDLMDIRGIGEIRARKIMSEITTILG